jgi:hypothetical protein
MKLHYQYILIYGNPVDGFQFVGPFTHADAADAYRDREPDGTQVTLTRLYAPVGAGHE